MKSLHEIYLWCVENFGIEKPKDEDGRRITFVEYLIIKTRTMKEDTK